MTSPGQPLGTGSAVIVDDTALLALGSGNQLMSGLVVAAHNQTGRYVYAPALCVAAAVSSRPQLAAHIGGLLAIRVLDLTLTDAGTVGRLVAGGTDWRQAHAVTAANPTAEWPTGLPVATTSPDLYASHGIPTIALN